MSDSATTFDVVRSYDPAIWSGLNEPDVLDKYMNERDVKTLKFSPDDPPVIFRCRVLTREQRNRIDEVGTPDAKRKLAFGYGVTEIRDIQRDGHRTTFPCARANPKDPLAPPVLDAIEDLGFGHVDMLDIGAAVIARSFLARGVPPRCVLPASSRLACAQMYSLLVARQTDWLTRTVAQPVSPPSSESLSADAETTPKS